MWALVEDGKVKEVTRLDPEGRYHSGMFWVACDSEVKPGWEAAGNTFSAPAPSALALAEIERKWRDHYLVSTEWLLARHRDETELDSVLTLSSKHYLELLEVRKLLRDWPAVKDFPDSKKRPELPEWLLSKI